MRFEREGFASIFGLQQEVREWARVNAPDATMETCLAHIAEELTELRDEMAAAYHGHDHMIEIEAADIVILLCHFACLAGVDLGTAVEEKWSRVKKRTYAKGEDGVYRHLKDDQDSEATHGL